MKHLAIIIGLAASLSFGGLLRTNEQGFSETHSYTNVGPGESVSNLTANLVLTEPLADISATPLGIQLGMSYNSHWRDPLWHDVLDYNFGKKNEYRNIDEPSGFNTTTSFGGGAAIEQSSFPAPCTSCPMGYVGGIFSQQHYSVKGTVSSKPNFFTYASQVNMAVQASWQTSNLIASLVAGKPTQITGGMRWGMTGFNVAFLALNAGAVASNWDQMEDKDKWNAVVNVSGASAITTLSTISLIQSNMAAVGEEGAGKLMGSLASGAAVALNLYNIGSSIYNGDYGKRYLPGAAIQPAVDYVELNLSIASGIAASSGATGVGLAVAAAAVLVEIGNYLYKEADLHDNYLDQAEYRVLPWAMSVNGYVGIVGKDAPTHPMKELMLVRAGGGSERYNLNESDTLLRNGAVWRAYTGESNRVLTKIYYTEDAGGYYLVKEPNGTWARFGVGLTKGHLSLDKAYRDYSFEVLCALPNFIHHFGGDSISISRDDKGRIQDIRHSRDAGWVSVNYSGNVMTVSEMLGSKSLRTMSVDWQKIDFTNERTGSGWVVMPSTITREDAVGNLTRKKRFSWDSHGDLQRIEYPEGGVSTWRFEKDARDGFLQSHSFAGTDGLLRSHAFSSMGWSMGDATDYGPMYTSVIESHKEPGTNSITSSRSVYRFEIGMGESIYRSAAGNYESIDQDTCMAGKTASQTARLRMRRALIGDKFATDYHWDGDRLAMTVEWPGPDSSYSPIVKRYHHDDYGNVIMQETNTQDQMMRLELATALSGSKYLTKDGLDTAKLKSQTLQLLRAEALREGRKVPEHLEVLDQYSVNQWHSERRGEFYIDTAKLGRNPYKIRDSIAWSVSDTLTLNQMLRRIKRDSIDSACPQGDFKTVCINYPPMCSPGTYRSSNGTCEKYATWSEYLSYERTLAKKAIDSAARATDSLAIKWRALPETVWIHWQYVNHAGFSPYGRYIEGLPTGSYVARKHPDTTSELSGVFGSRTEYDSTYLRPSKIFAYENGFEHPLMELGYEDSKAPWTPTLSRSYRDSVGSGVYRWTQTRVRLDGQYHKYPAKNELWTKVFSTGDASAGSPDLSDSTSYDDRGRPVWHRDARGQVTTMAYDAMDRPIRVNLPGGTHVGSYFQDIAGSNGQLLRIDTSESGLMSRQSFDLMGLPRWQDRVSADGKTSTGLNRFEHCIFGVAKQTDAEGRVTTTSYDALGRVYQTTVKGEGLSDHIWTTLYDDLKQTESHVDPLGRVTTITRNVQGLPVSTRTVLSDSAGTVISDSCLYDNLGNLVWSRNPAGDTLAIRYSIAGWSRYRELGDGLIDSSSVDWQGNPVWNLRSKDGHQDSSWFGFDGLSRPTQSGISGAASLARTFYWDSYNGRQEPGLLLATSQGQGPISSGTELHYNARGSITQRIMRTVLPSQQVLLDTLGYTYRVDQALTGQSLPRGAKLSYGYDDQDRLGSVDFTDPAGVKHTVVDTLLYRPTDAPDSVRLGKRMGQKLSYDPSLGLLTGSVLKKDGAGPKGLIGWQRSYDRAGQVIQDIRPSGERADYTWDNLSRLSKVTYPRGSSTGNGNLRYTWNKNGVMTSFAHDFGRVDWQIAEGSSQPFRALSTHAGQVAQQWDWHGNRTRQTVYGNAVSVGNGDQDTGWQEDRRLRYDAEDRMVRAEIIRKQPQRDTTLLGYAFSEAGLPVASLKGKVTGTDTAWTLRSRKVFEGPEAVADSGHDGWIYRVGMAEFRTDSTGSWKPLFVTTDPVGTTNGLVDDTGKVVAMYQLDAFGNLERYEGSVQTDYLFGGKEWDGELGLYWMGVRLYDPVTGQFTSRDALEQYRNPYSYTGASPLDMLDPWGLVTVGDETGVHTLEQTTPTTYDGHDGLTPASSPQHAGTYRLTDSPNPFDVSATDVSFGGENTTPTSLSSGNRIDVQIAIWNPVGYGGSSFGHISVNVNNATYTFSHGGGMLVVDRKEYEGKNFRFRGNTTLHVLMDSRDVEFLERNLMTYRGLPYRPFSQNCTTPITKTLNLMGIGLKRSGRFGSSANFIAHGFDPEKILIPFELHQALLASGIVSKVESFGVGGKLHE